MITPFTVPLDVEVWADREEEIEILFAELYKADSQPDDKMQREPGGAP